MIKKGHISTIDSAKKKAIVTFKDLDGTVSALLPIVYVDIVDAVITGSYSGTLNMQYTPDYKVGDLVVVAFFNGDFTDGAILGKIGGS